MCTANKQVYWNKRFFSMSAQLRETAFIVLQKRKIVYSQTRNQIKFSVGCRISGEVWVRRVAENVVGGQISACLAFIFISQWLTSKAWTRLNKKISTMRETTDQSCPLKWTQTCPPGERKRSAPWNEFESIVTHILRALSIRLHNHTFQIFTWFHISFIF